ncbi:MAG: hypothetical protein HC844_20610, partial [Tabrizicola sp.]|nr:hypothetical protein [Tabrizicola sp.]
MANASAVARVRFDADTEAALARISGAGVPDRVMIAALEGFGLRKVEIPTGSAPRQMHEMSGAEVRHRWLAALANEGFRQLDAGVARRPSDVDHLLVAGHGFPRWQGARCIRQTGAG